MKRGPSAVSSGSPSYESTPPPYSFPPPNPPKIIQAPSYNDVWATVLFLFFQLVFAVFGVIARSAFTVTSPGSSAAQPSQYDFTMPLLVAFCSSISYTGLFFVGLMHIPNQLIHASYWFYVSIFTLSSVAMFLVSNIVGGVIYALFALLFVWSYYSVRSRIPFSSLLLTNVTHIIKQYPGTFVVAVGGLIFTIVYTLLWIAVSVGFVQYVTAAAGTQGQKVNQAAIYGGLVLLVFILYWTTETARNVAGTFATHYFTALQLPNSAQASSPVQNVTWGSFRRATTTSFGSICFGSLLVALIQTLKYIARSSQQTARDENNLALLILCACLECFLSVFEAVLRFCNKYAFTEIAIYGKDYCSAGKDVWNLISAKGIDLIINDVLISTVLGLGAFFSVVFCAGITALVIYINGGCCNVPMTDLAFVYLVACFAAAGIGRLIFVILAEVVDSGTSAIFVCLAEDPATMQRLYPDMFVQIRELWPEIEWGMQSIAQ